MIRTGFSAQTMGLTEKIFNVLNFNAMATGALFSILFFQKNTLFLKLISYSKAINSLLVLLPFIFWFGNVNFGFFQISVYSLIFAWMIVLIVSGTLTYLFEISVLRFLGKISYGIYMYHWIILLLTMEYLQPYFESSPSIANYLLYVFVISATILIAHLSFEFIEKRILKFKSRFS
jgi:peptidoglycan/LPS O-acetylase OafA/YrhL